MLAVSASSSASAFTHSTPNTSRISNACIDPAHTPLSLPLTRSPSLGYIPLAFPLSGNDPAERELTDLNLHSLDVDNSVHHTSQHSLFSQSPCLQLLSQVTEELTSEAEANLDATLAMTQVDTAYNHDYSSFFAGVPTQPSLNSNDFSAYSLSTMPSQSSALIHPSFAQSSLHDAVTAGVRYHQQSLPNTQTQQQSLPISVSIKMSDLREMSRRITEKYDAYLKAAKALEESSRELLDWASGQGQNLGKWTLLCD